jgi:hypothetical protein
MYVICCFFKKLSLNIEIKGPYQLQLIFFKIKRNPLCGMTGLMKNVLGLFFLFITCISMAQYAHASQYWAKSFGGYDQDHAFGIQQTTDEGFIVAGYTGSFGAGGFDIWILKLNTYGNVIWEKTYGRASNDYARSIQQTTDGGYIVAGYTANGVGENFDLLVLKLDANGDLLWHKTYGGPGSDSARFIIQTSEGGYILAAYTDSFGTGSTDLWILKLDQDGNISWEKTYRASPTNIVRSIQQTADEGYIVAGRTQLSPESNADAWILKLDPIGDISWQKTYGGSSVDGVTTIQQTADEGFIMAGWTSSFGVRYSDMWVLKLGIDGNVSWQKTYGGDGEDYPVSIQQTSDQGFVIGGWTTSYSSEGRDCWVIKLDNTGTISWDKRYGGTLLDEAHFIQQTIDGGYIVTGDTVSVGAGSTDYWVLKIDDNGEIPGCHFMNEGTALVTVTSVIPQETSVTVLTTAATVESPAISSMDTLVDPEVSCCYTTDDVDCDDIVNTNDNCPNNPNGPALGTCTKGTTGKVCMRDENCGNGGLCSMNQEDNFPPPDGNGFGDACECEGDLDCDEDVDGTDLALFKQDFGRSSFNDPCTSEDPCNGDFDCDEDVDGSDALLITGDFGRSPFGENCPACYGETWCSY